MPQVIDKTQENKVVGKRKIREAGASSSTQLNQMMEVASIETAVAVERNKKKDWCFRCRTNGHVSAECIADLLSGL